MKRLFLFTLGLWGGSLLGVPPPSSSPSALMQELRLSLDHMERQIESQETELSLFQERLLSAEKKLQAPPPSSDKRFVQLEKTQQALATDLGTLKNRLGETQTSLTQCQNQLTKIEQQLSSDILALKSSLKEMLALLGSPSPSPGREKEYIVKPGDSLGQIALDHKTDIKTLKKLNQLPSDTIIAGQKLVIP